MIVLNPDLQQCMATRGHPRQRPGGVGLIGSPADPTEMLGTLECVNMQSEKLHDISIIYNISCILSYSKDKGI